MDVIRAASLQDAVRQLNGQSVDRMDDRAGFGEGCNVTSRIRLDDGRSLFLKKNRLDCYGFFEAEAEGVSAIARTHTIPIAQILAIGRDEKEGFSFLLMEFIKEKEKRKDFWENFAGALARLHRADTEEFVPGGRFGFLHDNYIGAGFQKNTPAGTWISFFAESRLAPQFRLAQSYFDREDRKRIIWLLDHLDYYLTEPDHPSLLHGDLWAGNFMTGEDGYVCLIDPAVYVGHAEADLAMTELFGGFSPVFYQAYRQASGLSPDYGDRRDLYNLYHLLNHLNLFGGSYYGSVSQILRRYGR